MKFSSASLLASLETHVPLAATGLAVALSGGADSASLLTAAASLGPSFRNLPLRAVHVDHGLQAAAAEFRTACAALCRRLNIALTVIPVKVDTGAGASVEAAARGARYAVLASDLRPGECLLTAHHREDQAETLLLQALRGAGLKGMSAMPVCTPFGLGWHVRPVLDVAHRELLEFGAGAAAARGFIAVRGFTVADGPAAVDGPAMAGGPAVPDESTAPGGPAVPDESTAPGGPAASDEPTVADGSAAAGGNAAFDEPGSAADPMNEDLRFDRVYLRRRVWPLIESRWPGAAIALSRAAAHAAEAQELLDAVAAADVQRLRDGEALSVPGLRSLPPPQRINAVRYWLSGAGADAPSAARIAEALRQMLDAAADHLPAVVWGRACPAPLSAAPIPDPGAAASPAGDAKLAGPARQRNRPGT